MRPVYCKQIEEKLFRRNFNPPTISVSLTSVPPQTIPEPSLVLGILAVLGLGKQLYKTC